MKEIDLFGSEQGIEPAPPRPRQNEIPASEVIKRNNFFCHGVEFKMK